MPYKKGSLAEQLGKLRRVAKRRIARLEKEMGKSSNQKEQMFYRQQIDVLRDEISRTYQRDPTTRKATGYSQDQLRIAAQNLKRQNIASALGTSNQQRKNFLTQQEMNLAVKYNFIGPQPNRIPDEFSAEEVSIFYRTTQRAWEGLPSTANRNQAILDYFGEKDLREFVRKVLAYSAEAVEHAHMPPEITYETEEDIPQETEEYERNPSDDWVSYVNILNADKWRQFKQGTEE